MSMHRSTFLYDGALRVHGHFIKKQYYFTINPAGSFQELLE